MIAPEGRAARILVLAWRSAWTLLHPWSLGLFALGGAVLAAVPGTAWGGARLTLWGLGGLAVASALLGGLGGIFVPGGLHRSPWLLAQPPGRAGRALGAALGTWAGLGALLLPALLFPLLPWQIQVPELRRPVALAETRFDPGPPGLLAGPGASMGFRPASSTPVARILLEALFVPGTGMDLRAPVLELSLDGAPFRRTGNVLPPGSVLEIRLDPPRAFHEAILRNGPEGSGGLWLPEGGPRLLGALRSSTAVWFWLWFGAWNLATAGALTLAACGALLSRPTALCLGAAWAFLALADSSFRAGLPPDGPARGAACGMDLEGGLGWLALIWAGLCAGLLAWFGGRDPDQEGG